MIDISRAPFPVTVRELWLPRAINGVGLPSSRHDGHPLTLTGAKLGSTADGVHFTGAVTSNINCGAIHNASAKLWVSFRFKLDQPFSSGDPAQRLWGKLINYWNDYMLLHLFAATGVLRFEMTAGGISDFAIWSTETSWDAGRWYHVLAAISDTAGRGRLRIDNGTPVLTNDLAPAPNGGIFTIGHVNDPGVGLGCVGVIADFFCGTGDLTDVEEDDLYRGIAPVGANNRWLLDEGRGGTAYDRGVDGNNGTLDAAGLAAVPPTLGWAWGRVKQPIISLDGRNDHGQSAAGVDVSGAVTLVWAGKFKAHYDGVLEDKYFVEYFIDNNNHYQFNLNNLTGDIRFLCGVGGTTAWADLHGFPIEIDDYGILIGTITAGGVIKLFANGVWHHTDTGLAAIASGGITTYIGAEDSPSMWDVSKPLLVGLFDTAWTAKQVKAFSKWLNDILSLGVKI